MGKIYLFTGINTYSWSLADFDNAASFVKAHNLDGLIIKIYEITQGEWYQNLSGAKTVVDHLLSKGIDVLPYGYFYGGNTGEEINAANKYLNLFPKFCMNMEDGFNNNASLARVYAQGLANHGGKLYVSTWADPSEQGWDANINELINVVDIWMPEAYSDFLVKTMYAQYPKLPVGKGIEPTFHILNTPIRDMNISQNFSLWEYEMAIANPGTIDAIVYQIKGIKPVSIIKNPDGTIVSMVQVNQNEPNESFEECGPFTASLLKYASVPGHMYSNVNAEMEDVWADIEYIKYDGPNTPDNTNGTSEQGMYSMFTDAVDDFNKRDGHRLLHYWAIDTINDTSDRLQDNARIKAALDAGYPVSITIHADSAYDRSGQVYPGATTYHVVPVVGYTSDGFYLINDEQRTTDVKWPVQYDMNKLIIHWASIIQLVGPDPLNPWLASIPNGDPLTWPKPFDAQLFAKPIQIGNKYMEQQFLDIWQSNLFKQPYGTTDISKAYHAAFIAKALPAVYPLNMEITTVDWDGKPIQYQAVSDGGHAEWHSVDRIVRIYDNLGKQVYQYQG